MQSRSCDAPHTTTISANALCVLSLIGLTAFVSLIAFLFVIGASTEDSRYHATLLGYRGILIPWGIASLLSVLAFRREVGERLDKIFG